MIDPFDAALSEFIDTLPDDPRLADQLLAHAPFSGRGDLPELAELATSLRAVPPHQPSAEWVVASRARIMTAPLLPPEKRGFTWLGTMFLPFTQLSFPSLSLPKLSMPSPVFARAAMALVLIAALASVAHQRAGQNPILQVTSEQAPVDSAQQAIAAAQAQVSRLPDSPQSQVAGAEVQGTPRDVVLLSQQVDLAELAIDQSPPADQPRLRAELQGAVRGVRFEGLLEGITNGSTLQVSGVAVQADPSVARQLQVGQPISLLVAVNGNGKLQAVQVSPQTQPASNASTSQPPAPPPPASSGGTAPLTSSSDTKPVVDHASTTVATSSAVDRRQADAPPAKSAKDAKNDQAGADAHAASDVTTGDTSPSASAVAGVTATPPTLAGDKDRPGKPNAPAGVTSPQPPKVGISDGHTSGAVSAQANTALSGDRTIPSKDDAAGSLPKNDAAAAAAAAVHTSLTAHTSDAGTSVSPPSESGHSATVNAQAPHPPAAIRVAVAAAPGHHSEKDTRGHH